MVCRDALLALHSSVSLVKVNIVSGMEVSLWSDEHHLRLTVKHCTSAPSYSTMTDTAEAQFQVHLTPPWLPLSTQRALPIRMRIVGQRETGHSLSDWKCPLESGLPWFKVCASLVKRALRIKSRALARVEAILGTNSIRPIRPFVCVNIGGTLL